MSGRVGAVHLASYEACIRADERERVLAAFESDLVRWRTRPTAFQPETVEVCAQQVEHVIAKIRRGDW